jgi:hypothetical protein
VLIAIAGLVVRLWLGVQFTWLDDDWTYIVRSNTLPLPRFLLESYNGHVGPGQFLLVWLVGRVAPLSFGFATSVAAVMGAASLLLWGAALRRVFGPRLVLLAALVVMALSPMALWAGLWWASAVQAGPLQLATAGMVLFAARWTSTRARSDLVGILVTFLVGLALWEKALLAVIPVLGVVWMMTLGTTRTRLRAGMPVLLVLAITSVTYLGAYLAALRLYPGTWYSSPRTDSSFGWTLISDMGRGALVAVRDVLGPGLAGGPWELVPFGLTVTLPPPTPVGTLVSALLAIVLVVRGVCRRHGLVPVLVVVLYVGIALTLGSQSSAGALIGVEAMRNPRLMADSLVVTLLALSLLLLPTTPEVGSGQPRDWSWAAFEPPRPAVRVTAAVLAVALAVGLCAGARGLWLETRDRPAMGWATAFRSDVAARGSVLLADGRPPVAVYPYGFWPDEAWLSGMLAGVPGARFSGSGSELGMVGPDGHVVPARVERQAGTLAGPVADCGYAIGPGDTIDLPLDADLYSWNWGVEASFVAGGEASLVLKVDGTDIPMNVSPGVSTLLAPVNSAVTRTTVTSSVDSATVCLVGLAFGAVAPAL